MILLGMKTIHHNFGVRLILFSLIMGIFAAYTADNALANNSRDQAAVIAVVRDGPSEIFDDIEKRVRSELKSLLGAQKSIQFATKGYNANWDLREIEKLVLKASKDRKKFLRNRNYPLLNFFWHAIKRFCHGCCDFVLDL